MSERRFARLLTRFRSDYGMSLVLLLLCVYYSAVTYAPQDPSGASGGAQLARELELRSENIKRVLIVTRDTREDAAFADALRHILLERHIEIVGEVRGSPADARAALQRIADSGGKLDAIATNQAAGEWAVLRNVSARFPQLGEVPVLTPRRYAWPNFLKADNLRNIADQIVIIAILAAGMTFVVLTGGIDLSVGSLIALSAVMATLLIRDVAGAESATASGMVGCCAAAVLLCGLGGLFSGAMVTFFQVPSFIVTLSMMLAARGLASEASRGASIYQVPPSFRWLGGGANLLGIPNGVVLMIVLYIIADVVMTRMTVGRYIYAIGGNAEAARLSGVPVRRVLLLVYALCGALAERRADLWPDVRVIRHRRRGGRRHQSVRRRGQDVRYAHRRFHYRRHQEWDEPHRRHAVSPGSCFRRSHSRRGAVRSPQALWWRWRVQINRQDAKNRKRNT
jgi:ribose transport system permease protein